jgi:hypothetical protein
VSTTNDTTKTQFIFCQVVLNLYPKWCFRPEAWVRIGIRTPGSSSSVWMKVEHWEAFKTILLTESEEATVRIEETKRYQRYIRSQK